MTFELKRSVEVIIKPISSLYDLLDNMQMNNHLTKLYSEYSKYIIKENSGEYRIINKKDKIPGEDDNYRNKLLEEIYKLSFENYIENPEEYEFNYIIVPYFSEFFEKSYPNIFSDKTKLSQIISYEYEKDNIIELIQEKIERSIRKIVTDIKLQYIKVIFHVPLYDNNEIEYRFQKAKANIKPKYYKDIFTRKNLQRIIELPMTSKLDIKENIQESIQNVFSNIKKRDKDKITPYIQLIQFFETLYKYSRNKQLRDDIENKDKFHKAIILYSVDFLDKDITSLNNEYYYELPTISILPSYIDSFGIEEITSYIKSEDKYIKNKYKVGDNYRCIGKINKVGNNKYKFTVILKELIFEDIYKLDDTISLYMFVDVKMFGLIYTYKIDDNKNKYLQINNLKGNIKIFNENDIKVLKYNNIDKLSSDNNELYISKSYHIDIKSFNNYLNKQEVNSIELLKYLKSPTELKKYEIYLGQNYPKLKKDDPLENKLLSDKQHFKSLLKILFYENTLFHLKPRNNMVASNTQYKVKLDNNISIYSIKDTNQTNYDTALRVLFSKEGLQKKYKDVIYNKKPNYIIHVNLLLQKNQFKKTKYNYDCKEIKYKLIKHTKRLFSGGSIKLKEKKKNKYNKSCRSKQYVRHYSRRKV